MGNHGVDVYTLSVNTNNEADKSGVWKPSISRSLTTPEAVPSLSQTTPSTQSVLRPGEVFPWKVNVSSSQAHFKEVNYFINDNIISKKGSTLFGSTSEIVAKLENSFRANQTVKLRTEFVDYFGNSHSEETLYTLADNEEPLIGLRGFYSHIEVTDASLNYGEFWACW